MMQWAGRGASAAAAAILILTTGCSGFFVYPGSLPGGGGGGNATGNYVYVANGTGATVAAYAIGTNTLTAVSGSPFNLGFTPYAVAINPANTIVFISGISSTGTGIINSYTIGAGGVLSLLATNSSAVDRAIDVSPDGQWLLGLDATGIDEYSINSSSGQLTIVAGNRVNYNAGANQGSVVPSAIKFAPNGQLVFAALGTAGDLVYTFNTASSSGALTQSQSFPLASGSLTADNALAVSPNGSALYFARSNSSNNGFVEAYTITSGTVAAVSGTPVSAGVQPFAVVVNTAGTNVYVANQSGGSISGYSGAGSGTLTALSLSPYSSTSPTALAADRSGNYLLAITNGGGGNNLTMYSFDSAGNLVNSSPPWGNAGSGPVALATTH